MDKSKNSVCEYFDNGCGLFRLYKYLTFIVTGIALVFFGLWMYESYRADECDKKAVAAQAELTAQNTVIVMKDEIIRELKEVTIVDLKDRIEKRDEKIERFENMMGVPENIGGFEGLLDLPNVPTGMPFKNEFVRLTSFWGEREEPYGDHKGLDLKSVDGAQIVPAADGVVTKIAYDRIYGYHVWVNHENGYDTLYSHFLEKPQRIKVGDRVVKGVTVLGRQGNTGFSSGPHLHYQINYKGNPVNPLIFLNPEWETRRSATNSKLIYMVRRTESFDDELGAVLENFEKTPILVEVDNNKSEEVKALDLQ